MVTCDLCNKNFSLWNSYHQEDKIYCEKCWKNRQEEIIEKNKKEKEPIKKEKELPLSPEEKRLKQLKSSKIGAIISCLLGFALMTYSIFLTLNESFFLISLEFLFGFAFFIIGAIRVYSVSEKIKDFEYELSKK